MASKNIFMSYATGGFIEARDALCKSAKDVGFDEVIAASPEHLDHEFVRRNHDILTGPRGAGYWLWKPQIILQTARKLAPGDVLVYCDAGRSGYYRFRNFPRELVRRSLRDEYLLGPTIGQHGPMSRWTKRDAFVLLEMDNSTIHQRLPIQATWSFWTSGVRSISFLEDWLKYCEDPRVLTDLPNTQGIPNLPDFKDHRHDQSVLSLVAYRRKAPYLDYSDSFIQRLLMLRPSSRLSHLFLKRIDDAELLARGRALSALFYSATDILREK